MVDEDGKPRGLGNFSAQIDELRTVLLRFPLSLRSLSMRQIAS